MLRTFLLLVCCGLGAGLPYAQGASPVGSSGRQAQVGVPGKGRVWILPAGGGTPISQPSIKAGIGAAAEGDTVLLSGGVFQGPGNYDIVLSGKNLTIRGAGAGRTLVDCANKGRGFTFDGPLITNATVLTGMTIQRADVSAGPGSRTGGGILVANDARPIIESCTIQSCRAAQGGGVAIGGQSLTPASILRNCLIRNNQATSTAGGGVFSGNAVIERCVIVGNSCNIGQGGGIWSLPNVQGIVRDSVIAGNTAAAGGGMLAGAFLEITGCTIVANTATAGTGGVTLWTDPLVTLTNSIIWGNLNVQGSPAIQIEQLLGTGLFRAVIRYCDIQGGTSGVFGTSLTKPIMENILGLDPEFQMAASGDYRLLPNSPCINAGDPEYAMSKNEGDIEAQPRSNGRVDIGADEHWVGFVLSLIEPGRSGEWNSIHAAGSRPAALVFFFAGAAAGVTDLSFGLCPTLHLGIEHAQFLAVAVADSLGSATYGQFVPPAPSNTAVLVQAVALDLTVSQGVCVTSNLVVHCY